MNGGRKSEYTRVNRLESGVVETSTAALATNGVRRILVTGVNVNAPLPPEAKKILKIWLRNGAF